MLLEDDRDAPIHIVHLLAACEAAAAKLTRSVARSQGASRLRPLLNTDVAAQFPQLAEAWQECGFRGATAAVRGMTPTEQWDLLGVLVERWSAPTVALRVDLTEYGFDG